MKNPLFMNRSGVKADLPKRKGSHLCLSLIKIFFYGFASPLWAALLVSLSMVVSRVLKTYSLKGNFSTQMDHKR